MSRVASRGAMGCPRAHATASTHPSTNGQTNRPDRWTASRFSLSFPTTTGPLLLPSRDGRGHFPLASRAPSPVPDHSRNRRVDAHLERLAPRQPARRPPPLPAAPRTTAPKLALARVDLRAPERGAPVPRRRADAAVAPSARENVSVPGLLRAAPRCSCSCALPCCRCGGAGRDGLICTYLSSSNACSTPMPNLAAPSQPPMTPSSSPKRQRKDGSAQGSQPEGAGPAAGQLAWQVEVLLVAGSGSWRVKVMVALWVPLVVVVVRLVVVCQDVLVRAMMVKAEAQQAVVVAGRSSRRTRARRRGVRPWR